MSGIDRYLFYRLSKKALNVGKIGCCVDIKDYNVKSKVYGKATYPKPRIRLDISTQADLFYSFHNLYFKGKYTGEVCRENATDFRFTGSVTYTMYDTYSFADRDWTAIPGDTESTDRLFYIWEKYGGEEYMGGVTYSGMAKSNYTPAPFEVEGEHKLKKVTITNSLGPNSGDSTWEEEDGYLGY